MRMRWLFDPLWRALTPLGWFKLAVMIGMGVASWWSGRKRQKEQDEQYAREAARADRDEERIERTMRVHDENRKRRGDAFAAMAGHLAGTEGMGEAMRAAGESGYRYPASFGMGRSAPMQPPADYSGSAMSGMQIGAGMFDMFGDAGTPGPIDVSGQGSEAAASAARGTIGLTGGQPVDYFGGS